MDKFIFALESFKNIQDLIKFIDQKSSAVLVVTGLIFTGYTQFLEGLIFTSNFNSLGFLTFISSLSTLISLLIVIYISIYKVLKPRVATHYTANEYSLFYYEHIYQIGKDNILKQYNNLNSDVILKNIIDQQHEVSHILSKKTKFLSYSFSWLFVSIVSTLFFIIFSIQL